MLSLKAFFYKGQSGLTHYLEMILSPLFYTIDVIRRISDRGLKS